MGDDEMTVTEAATLLDVTRTAVIRLVQRGTLPARRFGRMLVLNRADVERYRADHEGRQKPGPARGTPRRRQPERPDQGEPLAI